MRAASWMVLGVLAGAGFAGADEPGAIAPRAIRTVAAGVSGRWVGQDGHDLAGGAASGPNEVQDIHIALANLPPGREIVSLKVTGYGGDEWLNDGKYKGPYKAEIVRPARSRKADVYFEPLHAEKGRSFHITIKFDDGTAAELDVRGGKADSNLRMAGSGLVVKWGGQARGDWFGKGAAVGPDGVQDARLALSRLARAGVVQAVVVEGPSGTRWVSGLNPKGDPNAELFRDEKDPTRGELFFQPDKSLGGKTLKVTVTYEGGKTDRATVVAGRFDPSLRMPRMSLPEVSFAELKAEWLGQGGAPGTAPGEVRVALSGIPGRRPVVAAVLGDAVAGTWVYRRDDRVKSPTPEQGTLPLGFRREGGSDRAELSFAPVRDESGTTMILRLIFEDGGQLAGQFAGGRCDPDLRAPRPDGSSVAARPGDDLNVLANRHGTVRLAKGTYHLSRPLVLERPVTIEGVAGATLLFAQPAGDAPWTTAIKIHSGGTTLRGFAVRFAGPVRWNREVSWGAAVIGLTDNLDGRPGEPKVGLSFVGLDLESPPAANPSGWEEAPRLMRLVGAPWGGLIRGNKIRGGSIEFFGGPWRVIDNEYLGTMPGTVSSGFLGVHAPHDLVVRGNRLSSPAPSGKTWRFLILVGQGANDRVEENTVVGIGPRDDDTIPPANMPEVILTESYHLHFEGAPAAVSADRRVVGVVRAHGEVRSGYVVSVLSGPAAGEWRKIAQVIAPNVFLLDSPLPARAESIAVTQGFVGELFRGNTVDSRGGRGAGNLVLAGNHFGTRVLENRLLGGGHAFDFLSYPTESPRMWGWSHVPFLGAVVEGNLIEDSDLGGYMGVHRGEQAKSSRGRQFFSATLRNNTFRWTGGFLEARRRNGAKGLPRAVTIGYPGTLDPAEQAVEMFGDRLEAPPDVRGVDALRVESGVINGRKIVGESFELRAGRPASASRPGGGGE